MTDEFLSKFPIKLHPDAEMTKHFVNLFVQQNPKSIYHLVSVLKEEKDLVIVMNDFIDFIYRNGFDKRYNEYSLFGALQQAAARGITPLKSVPG